MIFKREIWIVEVKERQQDEWEPTVGGGLTRADAERERKRDWKNQFKFTRSIKYKPTRLK